MSSLHGGSVTQTALGSHPQHSLQSCIKKKRIPSNLYQSHVSNSFCCETNSKRVDSYFNMTTSAVLLHLKKSMSTLREVQGFFFFLTPQKMDSLLSVILPQPQFQKQQQIHRDFSHKNKHSLHHFIHLFIKIKLPHLKMVVPSFFREEIK